MQKHQYDIVEILAVESKVCQSPIKQWIIYFNNLNLIIEINKLVLAIQLKIPYSK